MLTLTITLPSGTTRRIDFDPATLDGEGLMIGRSPRSGLVLDEPSVSRSHARLLLHNGALHIEDVGSRAGSTLNGVRLIPRQPARLAPKDQVTLGSCQLSLHSIARGEVTVDAPTLMAEPPANSYLPLVGVTTADLPYWTGGELAVRVARVVDETHDVKTFTFAGEPLTRFQYLPGQFVSLHLVIDGKPITRSYTISSSPTRPHLLTITVKRTPGTDGHAPGVVSNWLHDHLRPGDRLTISGPYGDFTCAKHPSPRLLLISGGSGITPMLAMTRWLTDSAASADTVFLHGARSSQDLIARHELEVLANHDPHLRLLFITSRPEPGSAWPGVCGRITRELLTLAVPDFAQRRVFCCGPAPFMRGIKELLNEAGFPMDRYHEESFGGARTAPASAQAAPPAATDATPAQGLAAILRGLGSKNPPAPAPGTPPPEARRAAPVTANGITCGRSKRVIPCPPGSSLLEALEGAGVAWPSGCRMGKCGACKAKLTAGQLDRSGYDDAILSPGDRGNGFVLTCVGKPAGAVTLDA